MWSWQLLYKTMCLLPSHQILCWKFMVPSAVVVIKSEDVTYVRANTCLVQQ